jgi:hypothetical protein
MMDFSDRLSGCTVFSKIDLRKGYGQVPVRPDDRPKTVVIMLFGLFEFLHMPFGLHNVGSSFQRMMDRVLAALPFTYCYLDDLRIASPGLKCVFAVDSFEFLGHVVSAQERGQSQAMWRPWRRGPLP